jgi:hypothetical protein
MRFRLVNHQELVWIRYYYRYGIQTPYVAYRHKYYLFYFLMIYIYFIFFYLFNSHTKIKRRYAIKTYILFICLQHILLCLCDVFFMMTTGSVASRCEACLTKCLVSYQYILPPRDKGLCGKLTTLLLMICHLFIYFSVWRSFRRLQILHQDAKPV